jgi:hypothetical protein
MKCTEPLYSTPELPYVLGYYKEASTHWSHMTKLKINKPLEHLHRGAQNGSQNAAGVLFGVRVQNAVTPRSQKAAGVVLVPKKAPAVPSNSHAGRVLLGASDTKSCVKNATYPHSAPSLSPTFLTWEDHRWRASTPIIREGLLDTPN